MIGGTNQNAFIWQRHRERGLDRRNVELDANFDAPQNVAGAIKQKNIRGPDLPRQQIDLRRTTNNDVGNIGIGNQNIANVDGELDHARLVDRNDHRF